MGVVRGFPWSAKLEIRPGSLNFGSFRFLKGACPMRPTKLPLLFLLSILLTVLCVHSTARADDNEGDEYDVNARVVRISFIQGDVNLKRHDRSEEHTSELQSQSN